MDGFTLAPTGLSGETGVGWAAFLDLGFIAQMLLILAVTLVLAAAIAYHPATRRRARTLDQLGAPKTLIVYALVGAIITIIVKTMPSMALVVFGIGGLLRFRTNVGDAEDTGRVILVTVIGLACGLELYVVAVLTTLISGALLFALERPSAMQVVIECAAPGELFEARSAYRGVLEAHGCTIFGEHKKTKKGRLTLVYRASDPGALETALDTLARERGDNLGFER